MELAAGPVTTFRATTSHSLNHGGVEAAVHGGVDQHRLRDLLMSWGFHFWLRHRYVNSSLSAAELVVWFRWRGVRTLIADFAHIGIFNTTIAHDSFNIYMFGNTTGDAILTGALYSPPWPRADMLTI